MATDQEKILEVVRVFSDAYQQRDPKNIDRVMDLFDSDDHIELIGIGATKRKGEEWFQGQENVREIILGDWQYWGDVVFDLESVQINIVEQCAWISLCADLLKSAEYEETIYNYIDQMRAKIENLKDGGRDPYKSILDAVYFGVGRLKDREVPVGGGWPLVITAMLVKRGEVWKIHAMHWSMPPEP